MAVFLQYPIRSFNNWLLYDKIYKVTFKLAISLTKNISRSHKLISNIIREEIKQEHSVSKASTKTRGNISGSNKKPWKQKGTGHARAGSRYSPLWRGGGITFGPLPKIRSIKINRKLWLKAFQYLLFNKRSNILIINYSFSPLVTSVPLSYISFVSGQLKLCGINPKFNRVLFIIPKGVKVFAQKSNLTFKSTNELKCKDILFNDYIVVFI